MSFLTSKHKRGLGQERVSQAHHGYVISDQSPLGHTGEGPFWIEKGGYIIYRSAKSVEEARTIIDRDLAG